MHTLAVDAALAMYIDCHALAAKLLLNRLFFGLGGAIRTSSNLCLDSLLADTICMRVALPFWKIRWRLPVFLSLDHQLGVFGWRRPR